MLNYDTTRAICTKTMFVPLDRHFHHERVKLLWCTFLSLVSVFSKRMIEMAICGNTSFIVIETHSCQMMKWRKVYNVLSTSRIVLCIIFVLLKKCFSRIQEQNCRKLANVMFTYVNKLLAYLCCYSFHLISNLNNYSVCSKKYSKALARHQKS